MMTRIHCKNCAYSAPVLVPIGEGALELYGYECRCNAPGLEGWPLVEINDWCGEARVKAVED